MTIAIDFDGTIVKHKYPEIGEPIQGAIDTIKALRENGHKIFLWTMRGSNREYGRNLLAEAVEYLKENDIELCGVNNSPHQFSTSKKQYANIYIDDASLGCPLFYLKDERPYVDWEMVGLYLVRMDLISEEQFKKIWPNH